MDSAPESFDAFWTSISSNVTEPVNHGDKDQWLEAIDSIPSLDSKCFEVKEGVPTFSTEEKNTDSLKTALLALHPWRKGPFQIGDVAIDAEWDARKKWEIVEQAVDSLEGRDVLDIGCSNGYYLWRMLESKANRALGVEPYPPNIFQFKLCHQLAGSPESIKLLPSTFEVMPQKLRAFDTVFSMGVLYHRRNPLEHLMQIREQLKSGGQLVLETLIVDGDENTCLMPEGRYQQMNNVWFLPSAPHLVRWLERCKFKQVEVKDIRPTSIEEQRSTEWMKFQSLEQFLDPQDLTKTIEGYQAPTRCLITAYAP